MIEIPIYLAALYVGLKFFGLMGCVLAFAGRNVVDYLLLAWAANKSFEKIPLLAVNFLLLVLAVIACNRFATTDPTLWVLAAPLVIVMGLIDWRTLPDETKTELLVMGRRVWKRATP
jgi:hypothetical protein